MVILQKKLKMATLTLVGECGRAGTPTTIRPDNRPRAPLI